MQDSVSHGIGPQPDELKFTKRDVSVSSVLQVFSNNLPNLTAEERKIGKVSLQVNILG